MTRTLAIAALVLLISTMAFAQTSASTTASVTAVVVAPITITASGSVNFGILAQNSTVALDPAVDNTKTAKFTIAGTEGSNISITYGGALTLNGSNGGTMTLTPSVKGNSADAFGGSGALAASPDNTKALSGTVGGSAAGNYYVYVGGSVTAAVAQTPGTYTGTYTVGVAYR